MELGVGREEEREGMMMSGWFLRFVRSSSEQHLFSSRLFFAALVAFCVIPLYDLERFERVGLASRYTFTRKAKQEREAAKQREEREGAAKKEEEEQPSAVENAAQRPLSLSCSSLACHGASYTDSLSLCELTGEYVLEDDHGCVLWWKKEEEKEKRRESKKGKK